MVWGQINFRQYLSLLVILALFFCRAHLLEKDEMFHENSKFL